MAIRRGKTYESPPCLVSVLIFSSCANRPCGLIIRKLTRSMDINKNNLIFHFRLLRDKQASVLLRDSQLLSVMSQNKQIKRLSSRLSSYHSILVAFFHVGEQWLKWLFLGGGSSLMGSQIKPAKAGEINWFILRLGFQWRPPLSAYRRC